MNIDGPIGRGDPPAEETGRGELPARCHYDIWLVPAPPPTEGKEREPRDPEIPQIRRVTGPFDARTAAPAATAPRRIGAASCCDNTGAAMTNVIDSALAAAAAAAAVTGSAAGSSLRPY